MLNFIKKLIYHYNFFVTLLLGFLTFLTFLDKSFINLMTNLQYLLLSNIVLLIIFFVFIFLEVKIQLKVKLLLKDQEQIENILPFFTFYTYTVYINISLFIISFLFCCRKIF